MELGNASGDWVRVRVDHLPAPQGSHRQGFGKSVRETNPKTEPYRHAVAKAIEEWVDDHIGEEHWEPLDGPLEVVLIFDMLPPPKSDLSRRFPHVPPDLDKLIRSTFDGCTRGKLWADDARVVTVSASKRHATSIQATGATILVRRVP